MSKYFAAGLLLVFLAGCYRSAVRGEVVDLDGEALPGVAVSVEGSDFQDLSNALGKYAVRYRPGTVRLHFFKTGYTPAVLEVPAGGVWRVEAPKVTLWRLPQNRGVYFFEDGRYVPTDPVEPATYAGGIRGTEKWPGAITTNAQPRIIAYRLPLSNVSLMRMNFIEAQPEEAGADTSVEIWAPGTAVAAEAIPIDRPENLLVELRSKEPLAPGTYAVQWGALEGNRDPVPSIYLFSVEAEGAPEGPEVAPEAVADAAEEAAPEKKPEAETAEKP